MKHGDAVVFKVTVVSTRPPARRTLRAPTLTFETLLVERRCEITKRGLVSRFHLLWAM